MKKYFAWLSCSALAACSVTPPTVGAGGTCESNSNCTAPLQCVSGVCAAAGSSTGSTGGGSTGTTTGGSTATGSNLAVVNAAPYYAASRDSSGVDVCLKSSTDTDFGSAGVIGASGVAYGASSSFTAVAQDTFSIRVIAAGGDCSTGLIADITGVDMTKDGFYTVVVNGDKSTVSSANVIVSTAPAATTNANLTIDHALIGEGAASFTDPLPFDVLTSTLSAGSSNTLAFGASVTADIAPLPAMGLKVNDGTTAVYFKNYAGTGGIAAGAIVSIIAMGDVAAASGGPAPQLLVCSPSSDGTKNTCAMVAANANALALVRVANMLDAADTNGGGVNACVNVSTATSSTLTFSNLTAAQVSGYTVIDAGAAVTEKVSFVAKSATDCSTALLGSSLSLIAPVADAYYTVALDGYSATYTTTQFTTNPVSTKSGDTEISTENFGLSDATDVFANAFIQFPFEDDFALSATGSQNLAFNATPAIIDVSSTQFSTLDGATLAVTSDAARDVEADFAFALPSPLAGSLSVMFGGAVGKTPYVLVCNNDGSMDSNGLSLCAKLSNSASLLPAGTAFVRFFNDTGAAAFVCGDDGDHSGYHNALLSSELAAGATSAYVAVGVSQYTSIGYSTIACADGSLPGTQVANPPLDIGDDGFYSTITLTGSEVSSETDFNPLVIDATHIDVQVFNTLGTSVNSASFADVTLSLNTPDAADDELVDTTSQTLNLVIDPGTGPQTYVTGAHAGFDSYTAILFNAPGSADLSVLWCDNGTAGAAGLSNCTTLTATSR